MAQIKVHRLIKAGMFAASLVLAPQMATAASTPSETVAGGAVQLEAVQAMDKMAAYLRGLKSFTLTAVTRQDNVLNNGQKLEVDGESVYKVRGNDRLFVSKADSRATRQFYYNGKTLTQFDPTLALYDRRPNGLTTVVSVPVQILEAPVWQLVSAIFLISCLAVLTTLLAAFAYGRRLGAEVSTLARNAERLGDHFPLVPSTDAISEVAIAQGALQNAKAKMDALLGELNHRVNNTLSVILLLVSRGVTSEEERRLLFGRVGALARAHEALSNRNWNGVELDSLLQTICTAQELNPSVNGPKVLLSPRAATCLAQVFQELSSNAQRHGPIDQSVKVDWGVDEGRVRIDWVEHGARIDRAKPAKFGLKLIELCTVRQLDGSVSIDKDRNFWQVKISFPTVSKLGNNVVSR